MRGAIVAMSPNRIIGVGGALPWHYPVDLQRFKRKTLGHTIIMGRRTWESINCKPLPRRRNIVITRTLLSHVETFTSINDALRKCDGQTWFIGGAMLYEAALPYCELVDITHIPDQIKSKDAVYFPNLDPAEWEPGPLKTFSGDHRLKHQCYYRLA